MEIPGRRNGPAFLGPILGPTLPPAVAAKRRHDSIRTILPLLLLLQPELSPEPAWLVPFPPTAGQCRAEQCSTDVERGIKIPWEDRVQICLGEEEVAWGPIPSSPGAGEHLFYAWWWGTEGLCQISNLLLVLQPPHIPWKGRKGQSILGMI